MNNKEYYELLELLMINGVSFLDAIDQLKEESNEKTKGLSFQIQNSNSSKKTPHSKANFALKAE